MNDLLNAQSFKEFKWYNSHNITNEIQCGICRLELPIDISIASEMAADVYVTAQIICNQIPMHECPISSQFATVDDKRNSYIWDCVLSFPIKFRDLSLNAVLAITAWTSEGKAVGGTTMRLFDDNGSIKRGKQKLMFFFGRTADPNVINDRNETPGELYDQYYNHDHGFQMEKHMEEYRSSISALDLQLRSGRSEPVGRVEWLDRLTLSRIQRTIEHSHSKYRSSADSSSAPSSPNPLEKDVVTDEESDIIWGRPVEESDLQTYCCLVIDMPMFAHPVLHEERMYPSVQTHVPPTQLTDIATNCVGEIDASGTLEFAIAGRPFNPTTLCVVADWDMDQENLAEDQYRCIAHELIRGAADPSIKPNLQEKEKIDRIITAPGIHLTNEEMDMLFKFRYTLTENKKALIKFLLSINWNVESEVMELPVLLSQWKEKAPIEVADALKLLGRERAFEHPFVRGYAVEVLQTASNEELLTYLLQLVQALRYEPISEKEKPVESSKTTSTAGTGGSGSSSPRPGPAPSSSSSSSSSSSKVGASSGVYIPPLGCFLISRACKSMSLANSFYWYLKVETQDKGSGYLFSSIMDTFIMELSNNCGPAGTLLAEQIATVDEYFFNLAKCQIDAKNTYGDKEVKEKTMRRTLAEQKLNKIPPGRGVSWVPFPLNPSIAIDGLVPETVRMFRSAVYPCAIEFTVVEDVREGVPVAATEATSASPSEGSSDEASAEKPPAKRKTVQLFLKSGDDLRQDQLIMQLMMLMDNLLKKVNLDLKLLTYRVLAITQNDGIMEFVTGSYAVSAILKEYQTIQAFFRKFNPDKSCPYEISAVVMDTFVKSCAASCVITYLLGIGDRHLDNILICPNGQLFHIDFGFIFGQDPKPLPPPFRFTREMADAMGGEDSEHYGRFKAYCCQAYNWLRKSANLILYLLSLMGDAGIEDISQKSDLNKVLLKVEEKFRLDLTDEQAEQYFLRLINESLTAIAPRIMEMMHKIAVARR